MQCRVFPICPFHPFFSGLFSCCLASFHTINQLYLSLSFSLCFSLFLQTMLCGIFPHITYCLSILTHITLLHNHKHFRMPLLREPDSRTDPESVQIKLRSNPDLVQIPSGVSSGLCVEYSGCLQPISAQSSWVWVDRGPITAFWSSLATTSPPELISSPLPLLSLLSSTAPHPSVPPLRSISSSPSLALVCDKEI